MLHNVEKTMDRDRLWKKYTFNKFQIKWKVRLEMGSLFLSSGLVEER